jgi:hypothetical protein
MSSLKKNRSPSKSISPLTEPSAGYEKPPKGIDNPYDYIHGVYRYVRSMGEGGDHVDKTRLRKMSNSLNLKEINDACNKDVELAKQRKIVQEDIHKLLHPEVRETEGKSIKQKKRSISMSTLTYDDGEQMEPSQESRSISTLTAHEAPQKKKTRMVPEDYIDNTWRHVQSIGLGTKHVDKEDLDIILKDMKLEYITDACNNDRLLKMKCNAIHNKIRDLTNNWKNSKHGGKRTRRSFKKSNKRKSHKKKQF